MALIYIVEDDESIREIETIALKNSGHMVGAFGSSKEFFKKLDEILPDLVLLDVMLPDESGYDIIKKLRLNSATKRLPVIMVTAKTSEIDKVKGLDLGADDYLTKPFNLEELMLRVHKLIQKNKKLKEKDSIGDSYQFGSNKIDFKAQEATTRDGQKIQLSKKEAMLLKLLIENKNEVVPREKILQTVWGYDYEGGTRTVDVHVQTLRTKLGSSGVYIETVRGVGYRFGES